MKTFENNPKKNFAPESAAAIRLVDVTEYVCNAEFDSPQMHLGIFLHHSLYTTLVT